MPNKNYHPGFDDTKLPENKLYVERILEIEKKAKPYINAALKKMKHQEKIQIIKSYLDRRGMTKKKFVEEIGGISHQYGKSSLSPNFNRDTPTWVNAVVYMIQSNKL